MVAEESDTGVDSRDRGLLVSRSRRRLVARLVGSTGWIASWAIGRLVSGQLGGLAVDHEERSTAHEASDEDPCCCPAIHVGLSEVWIEHRSVLDGQVSIRVGVEGGNLHEADVLVDDDGVIDVASQFRPTEGKVTEVELARLDSGGSRRQRAGHSCRRQQ